MRTDASGTIARKVTADDIAGVIQLILAPVVMVTACAITLGALHSHSQAINDRLRTMALERLDLLRQGMHQDPLREERLTEIDYQIPELLSRHELMRNSILAVQSAAVLFVVCMLAIGAARIAAFTSLAQVALGIFVLATVLLLVGLVLSALEVSRSHRALQYEVERVRGLTPRD